ncbi:DEKNAAC101903 [Brettanomyces naardenensis]|uniref:DASH complex subunit DAD3 n=1 Tax=Brettanomyces naardenensis TaxID=13370 RepID=A0A448YJ59_BRENA|nr:DEKNAAC101903 [Brettanomyces naardenensis]
MSQLDNEFVELSPLEKQTLDQYQLLADQLATLKDEIESVNNEIDLQRAIDSSTKLTTAELSAEERKRTQEDLLGQLRSLESTLSTVGTLFKSSVYKILVNGEGERGLLSETK